MRFRKKCVFHIPAQKEEMRRREKKNPMRAGWPLAWGFLCLFLRGRKRQTLLFCSGNLSERQKFFIDFHPKSDYNTNYPVSDEMEGRMAKNTTDPLAVFNQLYKKMDEIYHLYAKRMGISDTALWLLYSLYEEGTAYTQRELCSIWQLPPQTVNSALKALERQEIIALVPIPGNQKNKRIALTKKGEEMTREIIHPLILAEQRTFAGLTEAEREALLSLTQKHVDLLQEEIGKI
jgi:DNA-binding MarR family transcriptional regulator